MCAIDIPGDRHANFPAHRGKPHRGIRRRPGVSHVVLMPNERGFERLETCQKEGYGAEEIILMISASERHNLLNFRMAHPEAMAEHARVMRRAHSSRNCVRF